MATRPAIQVRYNPQSVITPPVFQANSPGANVVAAFRGRFPQIESIVTAGGSVNAFATMGDWLFVGGNFESVAGNTVLCLVAVKLSTGQFDPSFQPKIGTSPAAADRITSMVSDGSRYLYIAGNFTEVDGVTTANGQNINGVVRFDMANGGAMDTGWNPEPAGASIFTTSALEVNPDKGTLYIAGSGLTGLRGTTRNEVGEVNAGDDGTVTSWNPNPNLDVRAVVYDSSIEKVYLGGSFTTIQGGGAVRLVRMTTSAAGSVDATWLPAPDNEAQSILLDGANVYTTGKFLNIGATPVARSRGARIDNFGEALAWNPNITGGGTGDTVTLSRLTDKTRKVGGVFLDHIIFGGDFTTVGGTGRRGIAAVDAVTGVLNVWDAATVGGTGVLRTTLVKGQTIYFGGNFTATVIDSNDNEAAIPFPIFNDANSKYFKNAGDDTGAGTRGDPFETIEKARTSLGGAFIYAVCLDSGEYNEQINWSTPDASLIADDGQTPTIKLKLGAVLRPFGARPNGRTKFSAGAFPGTFYFVSKAGNDGTGTRGDATLPFLTIQAALSDGARLAGDTARIVDSGTYIEDLNIGVLDVTIEAADGETPTLQNVLSASGDIHIQSGGAATTLDLYGLTFVDTPDEVTNNNNMVKIDGNLTLHDCSIRGGSNGLEVTSAASTLFVRDCLIAYGNRTQMRGTGTVDVENCYFLNNGGGSLGGSQGIVITPTSLNSKVLYCTFENHGYFGVTITRGIFIFKDASAPSSDEIGWCHFFTTEAGVLSGEAIVSGYTNTDSPNNTVDIHDCQVEDNGGPAVHVFNALVINSATNITTVRNCVALRCMLGGGSHPSFEAAFEVDDNSYVQFENCVSMDSGKHGFDLKQNGGGSGVGAATLTNCTSVGSAQDGYSLRAPSVSPTIQNVWTGCIEASSGNKSINEDTNQGLLGQIITFSCFQTAATLSAGLNDDIIATHLDTDPRFISTVPESENLALAANSVCVLAGNNIGTANMGFKEATFRVSAGDVVVEGFIFDGLANSYDGVAVDSGLDASGSIQHCTFRNLGGVGLRLNSGYFSEENLFENDGIGVLATGTASTIKRNVGQGCGSTFLVLSGIKMTVQNNTGYLCDFGQFDRLGASFETLKNNLYSDNGQTDYQGDSPQPNSAIGTLAGGATVVSGTRLNPLFRDTEIPDLRLQTIEAGFTFDSPAKGIGDDGGDAGAFDVEYGTLVKVFTLVDFETNLGGSPPKVYRNPTYLVRKSLALKLSEGDTHGGVTYSEASAFKREHVLTWADDTDMPSEQVDDLEAIYTTGDGECELSLDGGSTFIPVRVIRSAEFSFTEIADATYSNDSLPTPVSELVLRDSV